MKTRKFLMVMVAVFCGCLTVSATNVGTGLISQLTYLGDASQPDRIPLSPVIYNANYNYGAHSAMFESRPCYHGHFFADGRPEYEQNLAVIYGISCDLSDPTQMAGCTATFTLKKTQVPKNAPYTQEQVFAATLQTLLLYSGAVSQEHPLTVKVVTDGIPQPGWTAKYAKDYFFTNEDIEKSKSGDVKLKPLSVTGITIDDSSVPGVTYLVIDNVKPDPKITPTHPVFVPFMPEGEAESSGAQLVPVWPGNSWNEPLGVLTRPVLPYYEKWGGTARFIESAALPHQPPPLLPSQPISLEITTDESLSSVLVDGAVMNSQQFSAFVYACVFSVRPTEKQPLEIVIADGTIHDEYRALLKNDPSWKDGKSCRFVLDTKTMKLIKGSVPGYVLNTEWGSLMVDVKNLEEQTILDDQESAPPWLSESLVKISEKLQAVSEKDHQLIIRSSKAKLSKWASDGKGEIDDILVTMLTLQRYQNDPTFFETLWWRDQNRISRALAAHFANQGFLHQGVLVRPQLDEHLNRLQFHTWEHQMRSQELSHPVQTRLGKAVAAWEKRCEEASVDKKEE